MKIGIDISPIIYGTGVSVYTKNLIENLLKLDSENEYTLYGGSLRRGGEIRSFTSTLSGSNYKSKVLPIPPTLSHYMWNWLHIVPIEQLIGKLDVFHSSDWTQPPTKAFKVTTVHDLVPILFTDITNPRIVAAHKARLKWVIREVDRVIVPSATTAGDLTGFGVNKDKIRVIPEAVGSVFTNGTFHEVEKVKAKYRIFGEYILGVGVNPRKNTDRLIRAFEKIKPDLKAKLVIIGYPYAAVGQTKGVIYTGHVDTSDLPAIYSGANALVYPSIYEGFGLPILEAFSCKVPVVTSNLGSMKEIAGEGALLVDPYSIDSIATGIKEAIRNRRKLVKKGSKELEKYSWFKTAESTLAVYNEAL